MVEQRSAKILLVDDEPNVLRALSRILNQYDATYLTSGEEALLLAKEQAFDLVISDFRMPGMDGIRFLSRFMQLQPDAIRIILTGHADIENTQAAINEAEVYRFINKPWNNADVHFAVQRGIEHKKMLAENRQLADKVREQQKLLAEKDAILNALETEEPGITKVNWSNDGAIILDEEDLKDFK